MPQLASSNLSSYEYDPGTQMLRITFHGGRTYGYASVPQSVADGLGSAGSPGRYFNSEIKDTYSVTRSPGQVVPPGGGYEEHA